MKKKDRVQQSVMLDPDVRRHLRRLKAEHDVDMSDLINETIRKRFKLPEQNTESAQSSSN